MALKIISTGSYTPEAAVTNYDLEKIMDTSHEWIVQRTGIGQRRFAKDEDTSDLAIKCARNLVKDSGKDKISLILVATFTPDTVMPNIASQIWADLGLDEKCFSVDVNMACTGFCGALRMAESMLGLGERAIVIGSEVISKHLNMEDRTTAVLFGDGSGGLVVEKNDQVQHFDYGTVTGAEALTMSARTLEGKDCFLRMEGDEVFRFAVRYVESSIESILKKNDLSPEDLDYIVLHQANARIISYISKRLGIDETKFYMNLNNYANTSAASIPLALDEMNGKGLLKDGMKVLVSGFGAGLSYCSTVINW